MYRYTEVFEQNAGFTYTATIGPSSVRPSGENATELTVSDWAFNWRSCRAVATSHSRAVLSKLPVRSVRPSGENAAASTMLVCPLNRRNSRPVATSHSRTVWSPLAVTAE